MAKKPSKTKLRTKKTFKPFKKAIKASVNKNKAKKSHSGANKAKSIKKQKTEQKTPVKAPEPLPLTLEAFPKVKRAKKKIYISPSIICADFMHLEKELEKIRNADFLHFDIMDGHFVDNITIGPDIVKCINTGQKKEVHLMLDNPDKFIERFVQAGANTIIFHPLASPNPIETIRTIKRPGCRAGIALNPDKPLNLVSGLLPEVDLVLIMTVYAGFSGQEFIPAVLKKINDLRDIFEGDIAVDGGINEHTVRLVVQAGANIIVAGSFIFKSDPRRKVDMLRKNANNAW